MTIMNLETTRPLFHPSSNLGRVPVRREVAQRLLEAIFRGQLPAGTSLKTAELAEQFGRSSTPVREALLELETLGVIRFHHNRGAVVCRFGREELQEIYELRRILETEATRRACGRIERASLDQLDHDTSDLAADCSGQERLQQALQVDLALHELVAACCSNSRLAGEIRRYATLVQTIRGIIENDRKVQERAMWEHKAVIDALLAGDEEMARAAMSAHIASAAASAEAAMFRTR